MRCEKKWDRACWEKSRSCELIHTWHTWFLNSVLAPEADAGFEDQQYPHHSCPPWVHLAWLWGHSLIPQPLGSVVQKGQHFMAVKWQGVTAEGWVCLPNFYCLHCPRKGEQSALGFFSTYPTSSDLQCSLGWGHCFPLKTAFSVVHISSQWTQCKSFGLGW